MGFLICDKGIAEPQPRIIKVHDLFMSINQEEIHIGSMIRAELRAQGRTVRWFSEAIHRDYSVVHKMLKRESIDLAMLIRISKLLNHDFLLDISKIMNTNQTTDRCP